MCKAPTSIFVMIALLPFAASADVYKCTDSDGRVRYNNAKLEDHQCVVLSSDLPATSTPQPRQPRLSREPKSAPQNPRPADSNPRHFTGTGFAISETEILTNQHVVEGCKAVSLESPSGGAHVLAADKKLDLALLKTTVRFPAFAKFRQEGIKTGEEIMVAGFPYAGLLGQQMSFTTGNVSSSRVSDNNPWIFSLTAPVQPGNSGGPIFDASGAVIGVVMARLNDAYIVSKTGSLPQNVNFGISGAQAVAFTKKAGVTVQQATPAGRSNGEQVAAQAAKFTVLVHCFR